MNVYLAHALTSAPEEFRQRMLELRLMLNALPGIQVLEFNWKEGTGPDPIVNTYSHDLGQVSAADLVVAILDHPSVGLGIELQCRFTLGTPLVIFHRTDLRIAKIVPDAVAHFKDSPFLLLSEYEDLADIVKTVQSWRGWQNPPRNIFSEAQLKGLAR